MARLKGMWACSIALAGLAVAQPAHATLALTVSDANAGGPISACSGTDGGTGILNETSDANFLLININSLGSPLIPAPGLSSNQVTLTSSSGGDLPGYPHDRCRSNQLSFSRW